MKKFEAGKKYYCTSICDSNCRWDFDIIRRTDKTIWLKEVGSDKVIRKKIHTYNDREFVEPLGSYSMAPSLNAESEVKETQAKSTVKINRPQQASPDFVNAKTASEILKVEENAIEFVMMLDKDRVLIGLFNDRKIVCFSQFKKNHNKQQAESYWRVPTFKFLAMD